MTSENHLEKAEGIIKKLCKTHPKVAKFHFLRARILKKLLENSLADESYNKCIDLTNSKNAVYLNNYAIFLESLSAWDKAETFHKKALKIDPNYLQGLYNYAMFLVNGCFH